MRKVVTFLTLFNVKSTPTQEESTIFLYQWAIAGLTPALMVSAEAGWGEGCGPVAVPVFKTELRGVRVNFTRSLFQTSGL